MSVFPSSVQPGGGNADHLFPVHGDEAYVIERAALMQVVLHLEDECKRQETIWTQRDQVYAQALGSAGVKYQAVGVHIERIAPQNFFIGARPSLMQSSSDFWPSVTSRCAVVGPSRGADADQFDTLDCQLSLEILCKAGPVNQDDLRRQPGIDAEGEVNRQVHLLSAAVHMCIRRDPTFGGRVQTLQRPPTKNSGLPFALPGDNRERTGPYWIYMGRRLRYTVQLASY
jgi:hypothetical protein